MIRSASRSRVLEIIEICSKTNYETENVCHKIKDKFGWYLTIEDLMYLGIIKADINGFKMRYYFNEDLMTDLINSTSEILSKIKLFLKNKDV